MRRLMVQALRRAVDTRAAGALLRATERLSGRSDTLAVLTYHRVAPIETVRGVPGLVSATPTGLADQLAHLVRRCRVISLDDLLEAQVTGRMIGPRAVLVTFDDAHRDFLDHAWPVLRAHGAPVALFVPTRFPDDPAQTFWWDWLWEAVVLGPAADRIETGAGVLHLDTAARRRRAYGILRDEVKALAHPAAIRHVAELAGRLGTPPPPNPVLGWSELRDLARAGVTLAPHTRHHPLLTRVDDDALLDEVAGSARDLAEHTGVTTPVFAYPSGAWSSSVRAAVERAGFRIAFTTRRGINRLGTTDWLTMRRVNVGGGATTNFIRAQIGPWAVAWS